MTNKKHVVPFPDMDSIEEEGSVWLARMDGRELSAAERAEFQRWLRQSPMHREAMERLSAVWSGFDVLDYLNYVDPLEEDQVRDFHLLSVKTWGAAAIASSVLLVSVWIGIEAGFWTTPSQEGEFITFVGEQKSVDLRDGTQVTINTDSEMNVAISSDARVVRLERGEAHFNVAKDSRRPFFVYAGNGAVKAVGTAFSVRINNGDVEVTVSEGVVELFARSNENSDLPESPSDSSSSQELVSLAALTANQNAVFNDDVEHIETLSSDVVDQELLWLDGMLGFSGEPLSVVIAEVSRYTEVEIEIVEPELNDIPIGGFFRVGDVDQLLEALETVFNIEAEHKGARRIALTRQT